LGAKIIDLVIASKTVFLQGCLREAEIVMTLDRAVGKEKPFPMQLVSDLPSPLQF
jgi:hypothetical protein